jgi:hypothetical protein
LIPAEQGLRREIDHIGITIGIDGKECEKSETFTQIQARAEGGMVDQDDQETTNKTKYEEESGE